jgi:hypothetical protein
MIIIHNFKAERNQVFSKNGVSKIRRKETKFFQKTWFLKSGGKKPRFFKKRSF